MPSASRISWVTLLATLVAVPVVVGTIPFGPQLMLSPFASPAILLLGLLGGASAIAWAVALLRGQATIRTHWTMAPLALLILWLTIATVMSHDAAYSVFGDGEDLNGFAAYALMALLTLVTASSCDRGKRITEITNAVIASGAIVAAIALFQQVFGVDLFGEVPAEQRASLQWLISQGASTLGNPDFTGSFLVVPATLALFRAMHAEAFDARALARVWVPAAIIPAALVLTLTRGAWLALVAAVIVLLVMRFARKDMDRRSLRTTIYVLLTSLGAAVLYAAPDVIRRVSELGSGTIHGAVGRTLVWSEALSIIQANPVFGSGPAAFRLAWYPIRQVSGLVVGAGAVATDAHSYPLMLAAIAGVPAALLGLTVWIGTLSASGRLVWDKSATASTDYKAWWAAMVALSVALLTAMATTPLLLTVFVGLGVLLAPTARPLRAEKPVTVAASVAVMTLAGFALVVCTMQGSVHYSARQALLKTPGDLTAVARRAPWNGQVGLLAARLSTQQALQDPQLPATDPSAVERAISDTFTPLAQSHTRDFEIFSWWSTQLLTASELMNDQALLDAGLDVSEKAVALYPNSLVTRTNRARAYLKSGDTEKAAAELEGLVDADPTFENAAAVWAEIEAARTP